MANITCPVCKHRHPIGLSCKEATRLAQANARRIADRAREEAAAEYSWKLEQYQYARSRLNELLGDGAADAVLTLIETWEKLGEANGR